MNLILNSNPREKKRNRRKKKKNEKVKWEQTHIFESFIKVPKYPTILLWSHFVKISISSSISSKSSSSYSITFTATTPFVFACCPFLKEKKCHYMQLII